MSGQKVAKNVAVTLIVQLTSWVLAFAVTLFLPRYLGDSNMGKLTIASSLVALCGALANVASGGAVTREIARNPANTGQTLAAALVVRLPLTLLFGFGLPVLLSYVLGYTPATRVLIYICGGALLIGSLNEIISAVSQGQENLVRPGVATLLDKFLGVGCVLALVLARAPLWTFAAVGAFTCLCALAVNARPFWGLIRQLRRPDQKTGRAFLATGGVFFVLLLFRTVYSQADVLLMSALLPTDVAERTAGWYSVVQRLLGSALFIPTALASALLPTLTRLHSQNVHPDGETNSEAFTRLVRRSMTIALISATMISLPLIVMPRVILLDIMRYPATFAPSIPLLSIYGAGCIFWYMTQIIGTALMALQQERAVCRVSLWACVLTIGGCAIAIPLAQHLLGNAGVGAVCIDVAVEVYVMVAFMRLLPKDVLPARVLISQFARCLLVAAPVVVLLRIGAYYIGGDGRAFVNMPVAIAAGTLCLLVGVALCAWLCIRLELIQRSDLDRLRLALSKRKPKGQFSV